MKIIIGMPCVNSVDPLILPSFAGVVANCARLGEVGISIPRNHFPYDAARERIFQEAVEGQADYVMMMDSDMTFPLNGVTRLLEALKGTEGAVCASGAYLRRGYPYTCVWSKFNGKEKKCFQCEAKGGVHVINNSGLGFCLIDVKWVVDNIDPPYFDLYRLPGDHRVLDDESFFTKVQDYGGKLIGVGDVWCGHLAEPIVVDPSTASRLRQDCLETKPSNEKDE
jgi:hypothetical protein